MKREKRSMLLLMGDYKYSSTDHVAIVVWNPVRYLELIKAGMTVYLFGNFSDNLHTATGRDIRLYEELDMSLFKESISNPTLAWAPLAYLQIKIRLSRYQWIKGCLRSMIATFQPNHIMLSSNSDPDIILAARTVSEENKIVLVIKKDNFDKLDIAWGAYGIPRMLDPEWFHKLRWMLSAYIYGKNRLMLETCHNIPSKMFSKNVLAFRFHRYLGVLIATVILIKRLLRLTQWRPDYVKDLRLKQDSTLQLNLDVWSSFSDDEVMIVKSLLCKFFEKYPRLFLDVAAERLSYILYVMRPKKIIISGDQLDSDRMVAYIAKKNNTPVEYLPQGIILEDYPGRYFGSPFQPNRILAWNDSSCEAFRKLQWSVSTVSHPACSLATNCLRRPPIDKSTWKIIVLLTSSHPTTQRLREDYWLVALIDIYDALTEIGIKGENIFLKPYLTHTEFDRIQDVQYSDLQNRIGLKFQLIDPRLKTLDILKEFDLAIIGLTTAIFEAIFDGIPAIAYWRGIHYCGALQSSGIPMAESKEELKLFIQNFDYESVQRSYSGIIQSLQSGNSITSNIC